jgi:hypothetical protein
MFELAKAAANILEHLDPDSSQLGKSPLQDLLGEEPSLRQIIQMTSDLDSTCLMAFLSYNHTKNQLELLQTSALNRLLSRELLSAVISKESQGVLGAYVLLTLENILKDVNSCEERKSAVYSKISRVAEIQALAIMMECCHDDFCNVWHREPSKEMTDWLEKQMSVKGSLPSGGVGLFPPIDSPCVRVPDFVEGVAVDDAWES